MTHDYKTEVDALVKKHGTNRDALMPILQTINKTHQHVPKEAMEIVADRLAIPSSEVYSVVSFYSFLYMEPHGKYIVRLCQTVACQMRNEFRPIVGRLKGDLGIDFGQTTNDGLFSLEYVNCIGMCDRGPAMLINDDVYPDLTVERISEVLNEYRQRETAQDDTKQVSGH